MKGIMQNVTVTLKLLNKQEEFGKVVTPCNKLVTLQASRLRRAGLAYRDINRKHQFDGRLVAGVELVVDIGPNDRSILHVKQVHHLVGSTRGDSQFKGGVLSIGNRGVGTIDWCDETYGFVNVVGVFKSDDGVNMVDLDSYFKIFVHVTCVNPELLPIVKTPGVLFEFMVIPGRDKRNRAKIIRRYT